MGTLPGALGAGSTRPWVIMAVGQLTQEVGRLRHPECWTRCSIWHLSSSGPEGTLIPLSSGTDKGKAVS